jgi:hypothetical protein
MNIYIDIYSLFYRLVINYRFVQRIALQMNALKQGFQEILSLEFLKMFDEKEVEV